MHTKRYNLAAPENIDIRNIYKLLYASAAKYIGNWHSNPHTHNFSELFYITGGLGQFLIEDKIYPVKTNDLLIINPNVEHTEISSDANPLEYIVLGIEGLELSIIEHPDNQFCIVNFSSVREIFLFHLKQILRETESKTPGYEIICQDLMEILVVFLIRQTNYSATLTKIQHNPNRLCDSVKRYIDLHFKENISLDTLADVAHISKYHLVHTFTKEFHVSPINYLISCRIEEGCHLLRTTDHSLSMISRLLGFSSPSYFSQSFRKLKNMSPMEYRKTHRT